MDWLSEIAANKNKVVISMGQYSTEALILGIRNWGEADKIITLLSPEQGLIKAAAFGCRRTKSALAGALQMFNRVEVQIKKGDKLDTIRTCSLLHSYRVMSSDFTAMAYGAFVAEAASQLAIENFPQKDMYNRLLEIFAAFGQRNPRIIALAAGYQILEFSGMQLGYQYCAECGKKLEKDGSFSFEAGGGLCPECSRHHAQSTQMAYPQELRQLIVRLVELDWQNPPSLTIKGKTLLAAEALLLGDLHHVFERPLKSLEFIRQIS